jgi:beta-alanine degradation protein BauB
MTKKRPLAKPTVQIDNNRFIVTEWQFDPGAETGWHRHEYDYIVVPQTTGNLLIETDSGEQLSKLTSGLSYSRLKGVEHNVVNDNAVEFVFVEIELKD